MAVSTMQKLSLIALKEDTDKIIQSLMWLSCVEVDVTKLYLDDSSTETFLERANFDVERSETDHILSRISEAILLLSKYQTRKKGLFSTRKEITRNSFINSGESHNKTMTVVDEANIIINQLNELKNEENRKLTLKSSLEPWIIYDLPLEVTHTRETQLLLGTFPSTTIIDEISTQLCKVTEGFVVNVISSDNNVTYVSMIYNVDDDEDFLKVLSQNGFLKISFKDIIGTAEQSINQVNTELTQISDKKSSLEAKATELASSIEDIETLYDIVATKLSTIIAKQKLACTDSTVCLTGWVPQKTIKYVDSELAKFICFYEYQEPVESDNVPVLLQNNKFATPFESIIGLYSLPAYKTFDPTFIVSIFYFVIFGLMLGDAGYGLILTIGGFLGVKLLKPKRGLRNFLNLFGICGISCIIAGILFGSYFGDLPTAIMGNMFGVENLPQIALWFNPLENPIGFLILSLVLGAIHLFTGMGVRFYILCKEGHLLDAIFDIGSWYILFIGVGLLLVNATVGCIVACLGVAMLILTQGRTEKNIIMKLLKGIMSLYDLVSYVSDLLSYSRILALGLAATVISSVVNILGTMGGANIGGFIGLIIAFVVGHLLNLAINVLGSFVHTSRLQYIEFFGKFYVDGGRPFKPVSPDTTYTIINDD